GEVSQFDHIAVRIGDVDEWNSGAVLAALQNSAARALDLSDCLIEVGLRDAEAEVRNAAAGHRLRRPGLTKRDRVPASGRVQEDHAVALPEANLEPERLLVEFQRLLDVAHVEIDMGQSVGLYHVLRPPARLLSPLPRQGEGWGEGPTESSIQIILCRTLTHTLSQT